MTVPIRVFLSAIVVFAAVGRVVAQAEKEPPDPAKQIAELIAALKDQQDRGRAYRAERALGSDGPYAGQAVPFLIDALDTKEADDRAVVVAILADYGTPAVPSLVRALKRREASVRAGAAAALGQIRPRPVDALPALIGLLKDDEPAVRREAAASLVVVGQSSDKSVAPLAAALKDKDDDVRTAAVTALAALGQRAAPAVPDLVDTLKDKVPSVREGAVIALGKIGPPAKAAVPALVEALRTSGHSQRGGLLIEALGDIGPDAKAAVPELLKIAGTKESAWDYSAIQALGKIGLDAKAAVPMLIGLLEAIDKEGKRNRDFAGWERAKVANALGGIGPDAKAAVPILLTLARDYREERKARALAAYAVARIDPAKAAEEEIELAGLNLRLTKVPELKVPARAALTEARKKEIKTLVARLADIKEPDYGWSREAIDDAFAPLPDYEEFQAVAVSRPRPKSANAFRSLVEIGPDALPFLLDALDDATPTGLKAGPVEYAHYRDDLEGNPLNAAERRVLMQQLASDFYDPRAPASYRLRVGDVCFVAIGQIVGRPYRAIDDVSGQFLIRSPVESKVLRDRVRAIWSSDDPAKKLLDSLLLDFATEPHASSDHDDSYSLASRYQCGAALRLLYYFPKEAAPLVAKQLTYLNVGVGKDHAWVQPDRKNSVWTAGFIAAASWCREPSVREALADIVKRTDDAEIKALLSADKGTDEAAWRIRLWIEIVKNEEGRDRMEHHDRAEAALGPDGPYGKKTIPFLIDALDIKEPRDREWVVSVLTDHGTPAVRGLIRALHWREASFRAGAAQALRDMRPQPVDAIPALLDLLKDDDVPEVRAAAASCLGVVGHSSDKTVPALVAALKDEDDEVRSTAAWALGQVGRKAAPAVPDLIDALKDKNASVRQFAVGALGKIGPPAKAAVPALLERLPIDTDYGPRKSILEALGNIGPDAKAAVPDLLKLAKDKDGGWQYEASEALGKIGPAAKVAVPTLIEVLDVNWKGDWISRPMVAKALGRLGSDAKEAIPKLMTLVRDPEQAREMREAAAYAVLWIDPQLAAREKMEVAFLNVRLGKVPALKPAARVPITEARKKEIAALIPLLAGFKSGKDMSDEDYVPWHKPWRRQLAELGGPQPIAGAAFRRLIEIGPDALPFLLVALDDTTPTGMKPGTGPWGSPPFFYDEIDGNLLNPVERRVLTKTPAHSDHSLDYAPANLRLRVGDICFDAIGQIVGRQYRAVSLYQLGGPSIQSTVESKLLRDRVRALWSGDDPARKLFDSLLIDFATEPLPDANLSDAMTESTRRQCGAAQRLLYYFPKEAAPLIANRLKSLEVRDAKDDGTPLEPEVKNGVWFRDYVEAVAWCREPSIRKALADIAKRTDDKEIKALLSSDKK